MPTCGRLITRVQHLPAIFKVCFYVEYSAAFSGIAFRLMFTLPARLSGRLPALSKEWEASSGMHSLWQEPSINVRYPQQGQGSLYWRCEYNLIEMAVHLRELPQGFFITQKQTISLSVMSGTLLPDTRSSFILFLASSSLLTSALMWWVSCAEFWSEACIAPAIIFLTFESGLSVYSVSLPEREVLN